MHPLLAVSFCLSLILKFFLSFDFQKILFSLFATILGISSSLMALAQYVSSSTSGAMSDTLGRKPVLLTLHVSITTLFITDMYYYACLFDCFIPTAACNMVFILRKKVVVESNDKE